MSQTLSRDLRSRVIAVGGGMSRNAAVRRFGVGISTAIRRVREWRTTGAATAEPRGGALRSHRIEAFREVLPSAIKAQPDLDPTRLVFIEETGASTKMATSLRGRAKRGERCRSPVPRGHRMTTTFTGALRLSGMTAPMVLDRPMNEDAFEAYIEQVLVPTLQPGEIVIMNPTRQTSTRSRTRSRSSRRCCATKRLGRSMISGMPFATHCQISPRANAQTNSRPLGIGRNDRNLPSCAA